MQAEFERHGFARIQAELDAKELQSGANLVAPSLCLSTPRAARLGSDQVALSATAGEPGSGIKRVAATQSILRSDR